MDHLHTALVSVDSQIEYVCDILADHRDHSFQDLCEDAPDVPTIVARFMAVLELMRSGTVVASQKEALDTILVALRR